MNKLFPEPGPQSWNILLLFGVPSSGCDVYHWFGMGRLKSLLLLEK